MKIIMKTFLNHTLIGWLNILFVQFLFSRVAYEEESDGSISNFYLLFPIVPLTGWRNDYYPKKFKSIKLK
jgi:hypothetical protein